jgi:hypothetical protein
MSLSIVPSFGVGAPTATAQLDPYITAARAWFTRSDSFISGQAQFTSLKLNMVNPEGKYVAASSSFFKDVTPVAVGAVAGNPAPQLTTAITLRTVASRGLASRGRVFPPLVAPTLGTTARLDIANVTSMGNSFAAFINAINALDNGSVGVASKGSVSGAPGRFLPVTQVEVGRVIDTQRRRRNAMDDKTRVPAATAIVPPPSTGGGFGGDF